MDGVTYFKMPQTGYSIGDTAASDGDGRKAVVVFSNNGLAIVCEPWAPTYAPFTLYRDGSPVTVPGRDGVQVRFESLAAAAKFCRF